MNLSGQTGGSFANATPTGVQVYKQTDDVHVHVHAKREANRWQTPRPGSSPSRHCMAPTWHKLRNVEPNGSGLVLSLLEVTERGGLYQKFQNFIVQTPQA